MDAAARTFHSVVKKLAVVRRQRPVRFGMWFRGLLGVTMVLLGASAGAALQFPALTGRVVDEAQMISPAVRTQLTQLLQQHEQATTNQIVVVTVEHLQGYPIEDFGYQLGRHWGIGQTNKNNGVLLIVAKLERDVRIEVGYGLEGTLTDALASNIIQAVIVPRFKRADFDGGILAGTQAIIAALASEYVPPATKTVAKPRNDVGSMPAALFIVAVAGRFFAQLFAPLLSAVAGRATVGAIAAAIAAAIAWFSTGMLLVTVVSMVLVFLFVALAGYGGPGLPGGGMGRGGFGGRLGGGGFRGGGGSFGGGGASGRW